ncbi:MAG: glycosyltransferase family 4 protein [Thermoplasmata archaeon]|nr:MAG: glycosyltransferase family 4 protein [Thermoplasmata archaeon]
MKICFINPSVGTIAGGSEMVVHQFASHLSKKHEVTVLTGRSRSKPMKKELSEAPYEVLTVPFWPRFTQMNSFASKFIRRLTHYKTESFSFYYNVLIRPKIKQKIRDMDVISTHYWLDSRLFSNLGLKLGVPSIFHILGGPYPKEFFEADKSTFYVAVSQNTQSLINNTHHMNITDVVTPGIPSHLFTEMKKQKAQAKDEQQSLLFVGRLQESKGVFELIEMFKRLINRHPKLRLTIVGEGDILERLRETVAKSHLQSKVIFTGSLPHKDVFKYYYSSTIFVFPSKMEVFPLVSLEAMACGLPVVASDIPALKESTGNSAILLLPDDVDAWVENINTLLSNEKLRNEMSLKGREWAKMFAWEKKAEEYEKCLVKAKDMFDKNSNR